MAFNTNDENSDDIIAEINLTPLIDVMLVLLIIFMVTSSVAISSGLEIAIPQITGKLKNYDKDAIKISIDKKGSLSLMGEIIKQKDLKKSLQGLIKKNESKIVLLEGDKDSNLGLVLKIMDIAKESGAIRFAIASDSK